jgi:hypothetical protein
MLSAMLDACQHSNTKCLNEYELIRKYRCDDCGEVMMCSCEEEFGRRFLAHQLDQGVELETQARIPVTRGFRSNVCNACCGLPLVNAPTAAIPGRTSKIKRYYWRELFFIVTEKFAEWHAKHPDATESESREIQERIETAALSTLKELHAAAPKYDYYEPSQAEIIERYEVCVQPFHPQYAEKPEKGAAVVLNGAVVSPEEFVAHEFERDGWLSMELESAPFHALFGVMMWLLIGADAKAQMVEFGSRKAFEVGETSFPIRTFLPPDFGTQGYKIRRTKEIDEHFAFITPDGEPDRGHLIWLFDYWRGHSDDLREYLWAHRENDVDRARRLIEILPPDNVLAVLRYLIEDYWGRFVGWPDLLLWRGDEILMVEVKSSSDRLSAEQKNGLPTIPRI